MSTYTTQLPVVDRSSDIHFVDKDMELQSIRERRARLDALTASIKLPPLTPSSGAQSVIHQRPTLNFAPGRHYRHSRQIVEEPPNSSRASASSSRHSGKPRLPALSLPPMTPYHNPLPRIGSNTAQLKMEKDEDTLNARSPFGSPEPPSYEMTMGVSKWLHHGETSVGGEFKPTTTGMNSSQPQPDQSSDLSTSGDIKQPPPSAGKRRATPSPTPSGKINIQNDGEEDYGIDKNEESVVALMKNDNLKERLAATEMARKMLSKENDPPIDELIRAGVLSPAIQSLKVDNSALQYEAAWVITNIASGNSEQTDAVANSGAIEELVKLLSSSNKKVKEQAAWALGNIAADGPDKRNLVVEAGIVKPLVEATLKEDADLTFKRTSSWVLANLFRSKRLLMPRVEVELTLQGLKSLKDCSDVEVKGEFLWALGYITDFMQHISLVVEAGLIDVIVLNLKSEERNLVSPALRAAGNVTTGTDQETQAILDAGVIEPLTNILANNKWSKLKKEAAWALSNILAGTKEQIQMALDFGVMPVLATALKDEELVVKKEAAWGMCNLSVGGSYEQVEYIVSSGGLLHLLPLLSCSDNRIHQVVVECLLNTLQKTSDVDNVKWIIRDADGIDILESLLGSNEDDLVKQVNEILNTYFPTSVDLETPITDDQAEVNHLEVASYSDNASKYIPIAALD